MNLGRISEYDFFYRRTHQECYLIKYGIPVHVTKQDFFYEIFRCNLSSIVHAIKLDSL